MNKTIKIILIIIVSLVLVVSGVVVIKALTSNDKSIQIIENESTGIFQSNKIYNSANDDSLNNEQSYMNDIQNIIVEPEKSPKPPNDEVDPEILEAIDLISMVKEQNSSNER